MRATGTKGIHMGALGKFVVVSAVLAGLLVAAQPASATTFCVPGFFASCTNNGTNVAKTTLTEAMSTNGNDGNADQVFVGVGTLTEPSSIKATGSDPLTVTGAGVGQTFITTSENGNIFVLNLNNRSGTKMADLTIVIPAVFPDGLGSGAQIDESELNRVNVEVRNPGSDAFASMVGSNTIRDSRVYAIEGLMLGDAFRTNDAQPGGVSTISGATVTDAVYGFTADGNAQLNVLKSHVVDATGTAAYARAGGKLVLENSVIETSGGSAVFAATQPGDPGLTHLTIRSSTFVSKGVPDDPAIDMSVANSGGDAQIDVTNSIIRGYENTWDLNIPIGPGFPEGALNITHSNFAPTSPLGSGGNVDVNDPSNINQDPLFAGPGDYHLLPASPSVDAGDPATVSPLEDFDGTLRPLDGDSDGTAVTDQGAFEYDPPTCETDPSLCPPVIDTTAPKVSKVKFRFRSGKGGVLRMRLSEAATVRASFTPVPKKVKKGQKKRKVVKIVRKPKAGALVVKLAKRKLKPGRYRLTIVATDKAGNRSKALRRTVRALSAR